MEIFHPAVKSPLFKIIGIYEIDIELGQKDSEDFFTLRIELSQSTSNKSIFRYKAWRNELFRIQSTFPKDESGRSQHETSDENILVMFSQPHFEFDSEINAKNADDALLKIMTALGKFLEHVTLIKPRRLG